jgi:predicted dehydrogenase
MALPQPIRWGVIGLGRFGRLHARAVQSIYGLELAAICNRNPERLDEARSEFATPLATRDYRELLDDVTIDAVSITTHWQDHYEVAAAALASGKHVLLEKPMAATSDECRQLVELARAARGKFMVGHICACETKSAASQGLAATRQSVAADG